MALTLMTLPYAQDALEPHISAETLDYHHGKHHNTYVTQANGFIDGTDMADWDLEAIMKKAHADGGGPLLNASAQIWNHDFYWNSMSPEATSPSSELAAKIDADLGGMDAFREAFKKAAATQFGSGWAWLVLDGDKLAVTNSPNALNPLLDGKTPLLTIDVWEHAYYIDFRNRRPDYIDTFLDHLVNWDFASQNLANA